MKMTDNVRVNLDQGQKQARQNNATGTTNTPNNADTAPVGDFFTRARRTARTTSPAAVNQLNQEMKARIAEDPSLQGLNVLPYIGKKDGRNLSGVVAFLRTGSTVILHFIAVAQACELTAREIPVDSRGQQRVTLDTFVSDLYNPNTVKFIRTEIERSLKTDANTQWHNAGCTVFRTKTTDAAYHEEAPIFANIAYDAILDYAAHARISQEELFNVNILTGHQPRASLTVQPGQVLSLDGLPKRADLSVSVLAQYKNTEGSEPLEFTRASGYPNFIYRKPSPVIVNGQAYESTEFFQPEIIVTEAGSMSHSNTLESIMYAIYSVDSLIADHRWLNLYRDNHATGGKGSVNPYNLGALNVDLPNIGNEAIDDKVITTGDHNWVEKGLYDFADKYFTKTVGKAIDIPETGPTARLLGLLRATIPMPGMTEEQLAHCNAARTQVIKACDTLSGNKFSAKLGNEPLFMSTVERVLIGTYVENGETKDLNSIDHLSLINELGEKDLAVVYRYEQTFTKTSIPEIIRIRDRIDILRMVKGASVTVHELGYRIRMTDRATAALAQAVSENQVGIYVEGVGSIQAQPERGADYLQGYGGIAPQQAAGFNTQGPSGAAQQFSSPHNW